MKLTRRDEDILKLKFKHDYSNVQIADNVKWSKSTVVRTIKKFEKYKDRLLTLWTAHNSIVGMDLSVDDINTPNETTNVEPPHFVSDDVVTVVVNNKVYNFDASHPNYNYIRKAVDGKDWGFVAENVDFKKRFNTLTFGFFEITEDGALLYKGETVDNVLVDHIIKLHEKNIKPTALLKFMDRLKSNPSLISIESAIRFIMYNKLPIDENGYIYTYKSITDDYKDIRTHTKDNSVGSVVAEPREEVVLDPNECCAKGLHVCSLSYISIYIGPRVVVCKVDPQDIVSVPHSYKNTKMRVMRYEVVHELDYDNGETIPDHYIDKTCNWYKL